jgi:hypothetical protein
MSKRVYFVRECPTCGRHLHIRVEYLGKKVVCQHCHGKLEAQDPAASDSPATEPAQALLRRADELLQCVSHHEAVPPTRSPRPR